MAELVRLTATPSARIQEMVGSHLDGDFLYPE
jgi:hypothetical protein